MADSEYKIGFEIVNANRVLRDLKEIQKAHNAEASEVDKTSDAYKRRRLAIEQQRVALKGYNATLKDAKLSSINLNAALRGEVGALAKVKTEVTKLIKARHEEFKLSQKAIAEEKRNILLQDRRKKALQKINFELRRQGKTLKDLNLPASTYRKVVQGTAGSLTKVRNAVKSLNNEQKRSVVATRAATKGLSKYNQESMLGVRNQRNLNMSFSVFRSKLLLASFAIALVNRSIGKLIGVSADAEEIMNKFDVVFGKAGESTLAFAETLGRAVGRSTIKLAEMLSSLQDTFVPLGFARNESAKLSKALTQLSLDVASFNNRADDEVMRAFQSAIVGNHEAVRSFGIVLTEASLTAEALKQGIIEVDRELTAQEKVLARVSLLFNSTRDAQGDLIRTQDSYTNQLKKFNDNLFDLSKTIGDTLKPMAASLLTVMNSLVDIFNNTTRIKAYTIVFIALGGAFATTAVQANHLRKAIILLSTAMKRTGWLLFIALLAEGAYQLYEWARGGFEAAEASEEHSKSVDKQAASIKDFLSGMGEYVGSTGIALDSVKKFDAEIERQKGFLQANRDAMNETSAAIRKLLSDEKTAASLDAVIQQGKLTGQTKLSKTYKDTIATLVMLRQALIDTNRGYTTDDIEKHTKKYQEQLDILNASSDAEKEKIKLAADMGTSVEKLDQSLTDYIDKIFATKDAIEAKAKAERDAIKNSINLSDAMGKALETAFDPGMGAGEAFKGFILQYLQMIQQAIIATGALNKAISLAWVPGAGQAGVVAALVALEATKAAVRSIKFAEFGMDEIVTKPTLIVAGEAGAERVNITPLGGSSQEQAARSNVNINISGGLIQDDYVRNELIPALNKAVSLGAELNA